MHCKSFDVHCIFEFSILYFELSAISLFKGALLCRIGRGCTSSSSYVGMKRYWYAALITMRSSQRNHLVGLKMKDFLLGLQLCGQKSQQNNDGAGSIWKLKYYGGLAALQRVAQWLLQMKEKIWSSVRFRLRLAPAYFELVVWCTFTMYVSGKGIFLQYAHLHCW